MKTLIRKALAIVLCIALCAMMPVAYAAGGDIELESELLFVLNDSGEQAEARAALISAWNALTEEKTETLALVQETKTGTDGEVYTRKAVDETTKEVVQPDGLSDPSRLGSYWMEKLAVNEAGYADASKIVYEPLFTGTLDLSAYDEVYTYFIGYDSDSRVGVEGEVRVNDDEDHVNRSETTYASGQWTKVKFDKTVTDAASFQFYLDKITGATGLTHISVGSVVGKRTVKVTAPADAETMTFDALVEAAKAQTATLGVFSQKLVTPFEEALLSAMELTALDETGAAQVKLLKAWAGLGNEKSTVIAYPTPEDNNLKDTSSLSDRYANAEQKALMGPKYRQTATATDSTNTSSTAPFANQNWAPYQFSYVTVSYVMTKTTNSSKFSLGFNTAGEYSGWQGTLLTDKTVTGTNELFFVTEKLDAANEPVVQSLIEGKSTFSDIRLTVKSGSTLRLGCLMGWSVSHVTLPATVFSLDLADLYAAASEVDTSGFDAGTEVFAAALYDTFAFLNPEVAAVLEAWQGLAAGQTDLIAMPADSYTGTDGEPYSRRTVADGETVEGLADASVLGGYLVETLPVDYYGSGYNLNLTVNDLSVYKDTSFYFAGYDRSGAVQALTLGVTVDGKTVNTASEGGWTKATVPTDSEAAAAMTFKVADGNPMELYSISFGAVTGVKDVPVPLPENVQDMTAEELLQAAKAVDLTQCVVGVDAFEAAVKDLAAICTTVFTAADDNGTLTVDKALAEFGDTVTVTVTPKDGYELTAGSLVVCDEDGDVLAIPQRVGFRETGDATQFAFTMPADTVTVCATFTESGTPNMGLLGYSIAGTEDAGMRCVYRVALTQKADGYYLGEDKVTGFGVLLCNAATNEKLAGALTVEAAAANDFLFNIDFAQKNVRYDACDAYQDIAVTVNGMGNYPTEALYTRAYVTTAQGTVYTEVVSRTYSACVGGAK